MAIDNIQYSVPESKTVLSNRLKNIQSDMNEIQAIFEKALLEAPNSQIAGYCQLLYNKVLSSIDDAREQAYKVQDNLSMYSLNFDPIQPKPDNSRQMQGLPDIYIS